MARPKRESDEELINDVQAYLDEVRSQDKIPIVIRFAQRHKMTRQALYLRANKNKDLLDAIKAIVEEKEAVLEEGGLTGKFSQTMAIFSLKQLGWKDKPEIEEESDEEAKTGIIQIPSVDMIEEPHE